MSQVRKQQGYRLTLHNLIARVNKIEGDWDQERPTESELGQIGNQLDKLEPILSELDSVVQESLDEDDDALESDISQSIKVQQNLWDTQVRVRAMVARLQPASTTGSVQNPSSPARQSDSQIVSGVKLPKLNIKKFSGDVLQWQEFWDSFACTIHDNARISDVEKFNYLKTFLSGDAADLAGGFRVTGPNYAQVIDLLKGRFGNAEFAIFGHFEKLLELSVSQGDTASLQRTFDQCEKHIRSLVALGLTEDTFGQV